ncbi:GNAT family N-acetyltransferase [Synechococcus sp. HIMB2401]|uniref:GNAT family N-acetyltransferase n=1 Tax=Synechococcus sp. HIMB2401 TaxID=3144208 RepID=UPI0036F3C36C
MSLPQIISPQNISDGVVTLRRLDVNDVSSEYVSWLNSPKVNRFLESRHIVHTIESTRQYINDLNSEKSNELIFGIFLNVDHVHIGNIKIGPINEFHKHATVGLMIGKISEWGKGYGTRAIQLITSYSINFLGIESLTAGCYSINHGSYKSFLKAGWVVAGKIQSHWVDTVGSRTDEIILSFRKLHQIKLPADGGISLIGGGSLMIDYAEELTHLGLDVVVFFAPRHADDLLISRLNDINVRAVVSSDINDDHIALEMLSKHNRLCLCFGPAWIFSSSILEIFDGRIFNFNGIPLPKYIGGAHFTWQILNRDFSGGLFIQQITHKVDRGLVVAYQNYTLPKNFQYPADFENYNHNLAFKFLKIFTHDHICDNKPICECSEQPKWSHSLYFPRLSTSQCAWINWDWDGQQIADFCNAFDDPYPGAMSFINDTKVTLKHVRFISASYFHPYCYGLIVTKNSESISIAVNGGLIIVPLLSLIENNPNTAFRLGDRLFTPSSKLDQSKSRVKYDAEGVITNEN